MLSGKSFKMAEGALAIEIGTSRTWVKIPVGTILKVISGPDGEGDHRLLIVTWERCVYAIFSVELKAYGTEIEDQSAGAYEMQ